MTTKQKTMFAIVANVVFSLSPILAGAFNSHHKARLVKNDGKGSVTPEGAKYFLNRKRLTDADLKTQIEAAQYKLVAMPAGFQWAINAQGAAWQAGQGAVGQTLFANALSELTQAAQRAQAKAKPSTTTKAKPKAAQAAAAKAVKPKAAQIKALA